MAAGKATITLHTPATSLNLEVDEGATIATLFDMVSSDEGIAVGEVAFVYNNRVVERDEADSVRLESGDEIEVVRETTNG